MACAYNEQEERMKFQEAKNQWFDPLFVTENGLDTLARHLTKDCPKLKKLWIPEHFCSSMKKILKETKEKRKKVLLCSQTLQCHFKRKDDKNKTCNAINSIILVLTECNNPNVIKE